MKAIRAVVASSLGLVSGLAVAHSGHGVHLGDPSSLHPFLGLEHVVLMVAIGALAYGVRSWLSASDDDRE
jgi:hydrogenase/urease accessory protein HupE